MAETAKIDARMSADDERNRTLWLEEWALKWDIWIHLNYAEYKSLRPMQGKFAG
jgi:hypothetical protein